MRSLPIANAFRRPPASSCKGSSTGCFVLLVTESDCRRPRNVGVRQEDVRVSVRAVDIVFLWRLLVAPVRGVGVGGPGLWRLSRGPQPSAQLAERAAWLGCPRPSVWLTMLASRQRFAVGPVVRAALLRLASSFVSLGPVDARIVPRSQSPQTSPVTRAGNSGDKTRQA